MLKRSILDSITRFVLSGACVASFLTIPVHPLSAQDCCPPFDCCEQDPCCNGSGSSLGRTALIIGGAVVVGGIAGAIAGKSSSHRGHGGDSGEHGETGARGTRGTRGARGIPGAPGAPGEDGAAGPGGATGPTGPAPFPEDEGTTLTFTPRVLVDAPIAVPVGITLTVTPFVSRPDGVIVPGPAITLTAPQSLVSMTFPDIIITPPVFGTYHVGIQFVVTGNASFVNLTGVVTEAVVEASRDNSITVTELSSLADANISPVGASAEAAQTDSAFTYELPITDIP